MSCLVIGQPNAGKTSFLINFAAYVGLEKFQITVSKPRSSSYNINVSLATAKKTLIRHTSHTTQNLQSLKITIPKGKRGRALEMIDTCGLQTGIHPNPYLRRAMAQTINCMIKSTLTLHVVDLTTLAPEPSPVDMEIYKYMRRKCVYAVLPNKKDKPEGQLNLSLALKSFTNVPIIPISALLGWGFKEVYRFVLGHC